MPQVRLHAAMHLRTALHAGIGLAALAALLAVVGITGTRLDRVGAAASYTEEPVYLPKADYLAPISLGWRNVLADLLWFRTISYFGAHYAGNRTYPWLAHMCDLVTDLDPRALHVYRFAGVILPWEADQVDAGIRLLEKGVKQFPDSWLLRYHLGFHYYFFKSDLDKAVEQLRAAVALPGAHPAIARLAAVLARHQYGPETTLSFLDDLQKNVDSNDIRNIVQEQMREARLAADLAQLQAAVDAYRSRTGALPPTLHRLVEADLIAGVPVDPFDGVYEIDEHGRVRSSSGRVPSQLHTSKYREQALRGESLRDL
jgi:hypothetical protein